MTQVARLRIRLSTGSKSHKQAWVMVTRWRRTKSPARKGCSRETQPRTFTFGVHKYVPLFTCGSVSLQFRGARQMKASGPKYFQLSAAPEHRKLATTRLCRLLVRQLNSRFQVRHIAHSAGFRSVNSISATQTPTRVPEGCSRRPQQARAKTRHHHKDERAVP